METTFHPRVEINAINPNQIWCGEIRHADVRQINYKLSLYQRTTKGEMALKEDYITSGETWIRSTQAIPPQRPRIEFTFTCDDIHAGTLKMLLTLSILYSLYNYIKLLHFLIRLFIILMHNDTPYPRILTSWTIHREYSWKLYP